MSEIVTNAPAVAPAEDGRVTPEMAKAFNRYLRLVRLRAANLPGPRVLRRAQVTIAGEAVDQRVTVPPKIQIVKEAWRKEYNAVVAEAQAVLDETNPDLLGKDRADEEADREGLREPLSGLPSVRVVTATALPGKKDRIAALRAAKFQPLVEKYAAGWDDWLLEFRQKEGEAVWASLAGRIPTAEQLRAGLHLEVVELPMTFVGDVGRRFAYDLVTRLTTAVAEGSAAVMGKLVEKVRAGQKFKDGSFTELRNLLGVCQDFSWALPATLVEQAHRIGEEFRTIGDSPAVTMNEAIARSQNRADRLIEALGSTAKSAGAAADQFRRKIRLD